MTTLGSLRILNEFPNGITLTIANDNYNCCDTPQPGASLGYLEKTGDSLVMNYQKTSGHGCDGRQGQFRLMINATMWVDINFDSDATIAPVSYGGCNAGLGGNVLTVAP